MNLIKMDTDDIKNQVLVRLGASTTLAYYTDTILTNWFTLAHKWATSYKKWPYTEGKESTTYASSSEEYAYPEGWRPDSIRLLQVGGKRHQKLNFEDYQIFREEQSSSKDRVFTDYMNRYFINPNTDASGTITVWGQYQPTWDITDEDFKTVFSNIDEDGNEAIINRMLSYAMEREKKGQESVNFLQKGQLLLDAMWKRIQDEKFGYQGKDRGMWKDFDVLGGDYNDNTNNPLRW